MTNTSPITTTNFIAGTIGVTIALIIMPQIIIGTVSAQQKGVAREAANELVTDINNVCGNQGSASGSIELQAGYKIKLNYRNYKLKNPEDEVIETKKMACKVDTQTIVTSSWSDYNVDAVDGSDDDSNKELYDLSQP